MYSKALSGDFVVVRPFRLQRPRFGILLYVYMGVGYIFRTCLLSTALPLQYCIRLSQSRFLVFSSHLLLIIFIVSFFLVDSVFFASLILLLSSLN